MIRAAPLAVVSPVVSCALFAISGACSAGSSPPELPAQGSLQAAFTPWDDVEGLVVDVIGEAHRQILVQVYLLTSSKIAHALVAARQRGIDVRVLVDAEQLVKTASLAVLALVAAGIPVWLETKYQNAHNKIIVIDAAERAATVVTSSFNFTWTAQHKNAENILVVRDNPTLAARYASNWERHWQDATPYGQ